MFVQSVGSADVGDNVKCTTDCARNAIRGKERTQVSPDLALSCVLRAAVCPRSQHAILASWKPRWPPFPATLFVHRARDKPCFHRQ